MNHKEKSEQARADMLKILRTAIRLKHSIAADNEINDVLPKAEERFAAMALKGALPAPQDIKKTFGL